MLRVSLLRFRAGLRHKFPIQLAHSNPCKQMSLVNLWNDVLYVPSRHPGEGLRAAHS